jgi:hypothetical protein
MGKPLRILLQATIPHDNDWTIERFSLLREYLSSLRKWRSVHRGDGA